MCKSGDNTGRCPKRLTKLDFYSAMSVIFSCLCECSRYQYYGFTGPAIRVEKTW